MAGTLSHLQGMSQASFRHTQVYKRGPAQQQLHPPRALANNRNIATPAKLASILPILKAMRSVMTQVAKPSNAAADNSDDSSTAPAGSEGSSAGGGAAPAPAAAANADAAAAAPYEAAEAAVPPNPTVIGSGGGGGVQGSAAAPGGGGGAGGQSAVALLTRFNGVGYTFVLAGFLKIVTIGGLAASSPVDTTRTAFGKASPYLMVPVGLGLAWVAKQVTDSGLHESRKFLQYMVGVLVLVYFGLVKLMYKYEPDSEWVRRPRPRLPGPLADMRAELGDKDLLAGGSMSDSRSYLPEKPGSKELYDDVAWYEGRYPSQLGPAREAGARSRGSAVARMNARTAAAAASETDDDYGGASGVGDSLRTRAAADGDAPASRQPVAAKVANRRSFLSDNTR